jgi:O-antigen ligase
VDANSHLDLNAKTLVWGMPAITVLVWTAWTMDPVNLPKMVLLAIVGFSLIPAIFQKLRISKNLITHKYVLIHFFLIVWVLLVTLTSKTNSMQSFFGVTGRYTGALTYLSFSFVALGIFVLSNKELNRRILIGLGLSGVINLIYCGYVIVTGKDPIAWNNVYGNILGTFGNPNFISSFLGIFNILIVAFALSKAASKLLIVAGLVILGISVWQIMDSQSRQGLIVTLVGSGAVLLYRLLKSELSVVLKTIAGVIYLASGFLALLGMLQIGPLTQYIYKLSVSIRGAYWRAGWETMLQNPVLGVGPDSFGDWYTRVRDSRAIVVPGLDVFTNSPHNVFIEQGANGGIPLFLAYLMLQLYILYCGYRYIRLSNGFDYVFAASFFGWLGFTAQSLISINQIGLAIWGYVLGGMTVGIYHNAKVELEPATSSPKSKNLVQGEFGFLRVIAGATIGLLIAIPPFYADAKWRSALTSTQLDQILKAASQWPQSTDRYIEVSKTLFKNGYNKETLEFVRKGIEFNDGNFRLWYFLYQIPESTQSEKDLAIERLRILDPNLKIK